jgi:hypothetical protein
MDVIFEVIKWFLITALTLAAIIWVRKRFGQQFSITTIDLSISILPFVFWLLFSGKLNSLKVGDVSFGFLFEEVQAKKIEKSNITILDIRHTPVALKAGTGYIDNIVKEQKEALIFSLGYENYQEDAIEEYLRKLIGTTIRYIVFQMEDTGEFIGIIDFNSLTYQLLGVDSDEYSISWFADIIAKGNKSELEKLTGYISKENSVGINDSRAQALEKSVKINSEYLPFIDNVGKFVGIITQSRINSLILTDLNNESVQKNSKK